MYICVCVRARAYVCVYVCMYVCMCCMYVYMHLYMYMCMYVRIHVCTYMYVYIYVCIQNAEKLHAQTSWVERGDQNKYLFSRNCVSETRPCSATNRQIGSVWVWMSSETAEVFWRKVVFRTNLGQMFERTATDLDTQPTKMQQRLTCALKEWQVAALVVAALTMRAIRSFSESTGDVKIKVLMWPHRKNSIGVRSGDLGGQAADQPLPIQWSL